MTSLSRGFTFGPGFKDFEKFFIGYDDLFVPETLNLFHYQTINVLCLVQ